jgi:DNA-binding MarR family transcriptional regulator
MTDKDELIEKIRDFNRFYTSMIGVLDKHILESPFSLSEARVLFEINRMEQCTARKIMDKMKIDEGYLSRILDRFVKTGLVRKIKSTEDARAYVLLVTPKGRRQFEKINKASSKALYNMVEHVHAKALPQLVMHMEAIKSILAGKD